ncbi:MAG TPA: DUF2059 domain-containing protein [Terracidiphilus sp.]|jgi:hypothetical protein
MKTKLFVGVLAVMLTGSAIGQAQAFAVGADGKAQEERTIAADDQATTEQLSKLFDVMRVKEQVQSMRKIVPSMVQQQIQAAMKQTETNLPAGTRLTDDQRERLQQVMTKYVGKAMDLYPSDEMLTDMNGIYQRHLSKEDVDGLITFYGSPAGQHLLDAQPLIAREFMPIVMAKVQERSQAMTKEMVKEMAEIVPRTKPAPKTGTTKPPAK